MHLSRTEFFNSSKMLPNKFHNRQRTHHKATGKYLLSPVLRKYKQSTFICLLFRRSTKFADRHVNSRRRVFVAHCFPTREAIAQRKVSTRLIARSINMHQFAAASCVYIYTSRHLRGAFLHNQLKTPGHCVYTL